MDIDIDLRSDTPIGKIFADWPLAMQLVKDPLGRVRALKHACGIHPQSIPRDPITKLAAIPYKDAETIGYFKIDMLHNHVYNYFESKEEINALLELDPPWELLKLQSIVKQCFQISKHWDLIKQLQPKSVNDLADAIALIRPGKRQMVDKYLTHKEEVRKALYDFRDENYSFKKGHAIAYAQVIVLQLHLLSAGVTFD
jgi:DNA polymerase III alpha subunit